MRRVVGIAAALCAAMAVVLYSGLLGARGPSATPLRDFEAPFRFGYFEVPPDNPLTEEGVELGRRLFYDPLLSASLVRTGTQDAAAPTIELCADLMRMFAGDKADEALDMRQTSNVTTERGASRLLADNYAGMVSVCPARDHADS